MTDNRITCNEFSQQFNLPKSPYQPVFMEKGAALTITFQIAPQKIIRYR